MLNSITQRKVFERYLTETEAKTLLRHVRKFANVLARRDAAWMGLLSRTGLRVGSLAALTLSDARVGLSSDTLPVRHAKGGRVYEVLLSKEAKVYLRQLQSIRHEMGAPNEPDAPLLVSRNHQAMSIRSFQARMSKWVKESGIGRDATPHWWRHTVAKRMMAHSEARDPLAMVQLALGHHCRESTMIYALPDREQLAEAMNCW